MTCPVCNDGELLLRRSVYKTFKAGPNGHLWECKEMMDYEDTSIGCSKCTATWDRINTFITQGGRGNECLLMPDPDDAIIE